LDVPRPAYRALRETARRLKGRGWSEQIHSSLTRAFVNAARAYAYRSELEALLDPACTQALRANGRRVGGFLDLL
jgi:hypothetical protein